MTTNVAGDLTQPDKISPLPHFTLINGEQAYNFNAPSFKQPTVISV